MTIALVASARAIFVTALSRAAAESALRVRNILIALKDRQELRRLLESEDHRLADIGVDRDFLRAALAEPLWRNPTAALARRTKDKRDRSDGEVFFKASTGGTRERRRRPTAEHHRHVIPACPTVPPWMDLERYLAVLDRKPGLVGARKNDEFQQSASTRSEL